METNLDNLKRFIETIRNIRWLDRIFGWGRVKNQLVDAATELSLAGARLKEQEGLLQTLSSDSKLLEERHGQLSKRKAELDIEVATLKRDLANLQAEGAEIRKQNIQLNRDDSFRKQEHSGAIASLREIQAQLSQERGKEKDEKAAAEIERIRLMKHTWSNHEDSARNAIKTISQKYAISYVEQVPFKGSPDNTLHICDEYVVFDAKSPGSDDLKNFPAYLKDQAEKAQKYSKQENVKSDIFFVIPSNTLDHLTNFVYRHGDHTVYIISVDALEPVILSLKKIEEYEFAKELTPEDRENICRILGRFAHLSKRRIQVDSFFARQFIELAYKCETDLPEDVLGSVVEFERSEKLNPPQEKRAKAIPIADLEKEHQKINQEAEGKGILMEGGDIPARLDEWPLYKNE